MENKFEEKLTFWNSRANLGFLAGSNDGILKSLEMREIEGYIKDGMKILEIGCGNGVTAIEFVKKYKVDILAVDYADQMIADAEKNYESIKDSLVGTAKFKVMRVEEIPSITEKFDMIYCERVLINLGTWEEQKQVLINIAGLLNDTGIFCMCENSIDGLSKINDYRKGVELDEILPPWHNRYFVEAELEEFSKESYLKLIERNNFTSTYYLLSRVVNAALAKRNSEEPSYDSPINQLAFSLPPIGDFGQTKIWVWTKK